MPEPIQGYFAFSLRSDLVGGKNFHCRLAVDEGPAGLSIQVMQAEITQAVLGGNTPIDVSDCTLSVANDRDGTLELRMRGRTAPERDGEPSQPFEASAFFKHFRPTPPPDDLKGEGEFREGEEDYRPRTAVVKREPRAGGR